MQIGMIGLGKMGANMVRRLMRDGHECVVNNRSPEKIEKMEGEGAVGAYSLEEMVKQLVKPRAVWVMVPAGKPTEKTVSELADLLEEGDMVIDGGNSYYKDTVRRGKMLQEKGIHYMDVGTSGGVWGIDRGYCLMIGGDQEAVEHLDPIFSTIAPGKGDIPLTPNRENLNPTADEGYLRCGSTGAGHFVKMVHNGVEYAIMQAYAEGFEIFEQATSKELPEEHRFDLNIADIAEVWRRGSVIGSWLLDLSAMALAEDPKLENYEGYVSDSGEGRWTVMAAVEEAVSAEVISAALFNRFRSRKGHTFAEKSLSAMRYKFGGHVEQHSFSKENK
jgi:6-phosphogluconate dehydrogenase